MSETPNLDRLLDECRKWMAANYDPAGDMQAQAKQCEQAVIGEAPSSDLQPAYDELKQALLDDKGGDVGGFSHPGLFNASLILGMELAPGAVVHPATEWHRALGGFLLGAPGGIVATAEAFPPARPDIPQLREPEDPRNAE